MPFVCWAPSVFSPDVKVVSSAAPLGASPVSTAANSSTPISTVLIVGLTSSSAPGAIEGVRSRGGEGSWLVGNTDVGGTGVGAAGGIMYSWLAVLQEDQVSKSCSNAKCQKKKRRTRDTRLF